MMKIFSIFAEPLGWIMSLFYDWMGSYFLTILVFTVVIRLAMFPLSLNQQKTQAQRAKLAPRLDRLQKKYGHDQQKLMEKQQELYQKEGIKMTAGCLPSIVQMLVLMSVIAVIYKPLTYLQDIPATVIDTSIVAVAENIEDETVKKQLVKMDKDGAITGVQNSYYSELNLLKHVENYPTEVKKALSDAGVVNVEGTYNTMVETQKEFKVFGLSLLETPWHGFANPSPLWIIAIISGLTALGTSLISMHYTKNSMPNQQAGGCSPNMMMLTMPAMSLFISFGVPAGVGLYWILSNLLAMLQTVVLNQIYNPTKIREQAQIEYEERRRRKKEDKKRLAESRAREEAAIKAEEEAERAAQNTKKKTSAPSDTTSADDGKEEN